jgi:hypothetical protein
LNLLKFLAAYTLFSAGIILNDVIQFYSSHRSGANKDQEATLSSVQITNISVEIMLSLTHLIVFILVIKLYSFHLWLIKQDMTTLEYYLKCRDKPANSSKRTIGARVAPSTSDNPRRKLRTLEAGQAKEVLDEENKTSAQECKKTLRDELDSNSGAGSNNDAKNKNIQGEKDTDRALLSQRNRDSTSLLVGVDPSNSRLGIQRVIITNLQSNSKISSNQQALVLKKNRENLQMSKLSLSRKTPMRLRSGSHDNEIQKSELTRDSKKLGPKQLPPLVLNGVYKKSLRNSSKQQAEPVKTATPFKMAKELREELSSSKHTDQMDENLPPTSKPDLGEVLRQTLPQREPSHKDSDAIQHKQKAQSSATSVELISESKGANLDSIDGTSKSSYPKA